MRAKPRCGHGVALSISKKAKLPFVERTAQECAELPALPSTLIRFADFCLLVLNRIGRGLTIVPATIALAAALPAFGHAELGGDVSAPNRFNDLRAVQVGMVAALLTAGNAK